MSKVVMICGKLCSGKTTYAERLAEEEHAALFSVDELMLLFFGQDAGEKHDEYTEKIKAFLLDKTARHVKRGVSVVLDWGFWRKGERDAVRAWFREQSVPCELHYLDVPDAVWKERIETRNRAVLDGKNDAYFIDEGLAAKFEGLFERPGREEIDVWVTF